jgi:hypothetical protein
VTNLIGYHNYNNCRVIIKDANYNIVLTDTKITDFDNELLSIQIPNKFDVTTYKELNLLILCKNQVFEYHGKVKRSFSDHIEIGLYKGRHVEHRRAQRYSIKAKGLVDKLYIRGQKVKLNQYIEVDIENISKTGVMIKALSNTFYQDIPFDLIFLKQDLTVTCLLVWNSKIDTKYSYFGCKFIKTERKKVYANEEVS